MTISPWRPSWPVHESCASCCLVHWTLVQCLTLSDTNYPPIIWKYKMCHLNEFKHQTENFYLNTNLKNMYNFYSDPQIGKFVFIGQDLISQFLSYHVADRDCTYTKILCLRTYARRSTPPPGIRKAYARHLTPSPSLSAYVICGCSLMHSRILRTFPTINTGDNIFISPN